MVQIDCQWPCYLCEAFVSLWSGKNTWTLRFYWSLISFKVPVHFYFPFITTTYFSELFTYVLPYVIFYILFPHVLILALKFLCDQNEPLECFALCLHPLHKRRNNRVGNFTEHSHSMIMDVQALHLLDAFCHIAFQHQTMWRPWFILVYLLYSLKNRHVMRICYLFHKLLFKQLLGALGASSDAAVAWVLQLWYLSL